ncbi:DUF2752 domain-containing protein [Nocardioides sp. cx-169]|uniref:DUF2752 domain-containing protein n=1 Tax=Nocardioides sp. cx-169 TaxID=2899080 RepID=UPI001E4319AF|nr:DUF2752 domain-containing protein [Nocardioides sp. cx-169]MCD4534796.1 DUF2752 domain-containing protein [Nocardioides sp. cx-169]
MAAPLTTIGALGALTLALHLRDPHVHASWGLCPSALMGFWCPGCGGLRAVNDLTNLQLVDAASSNLALVVALPFALAALALWTADRWRGRRRAVPANAVAWTAFAAVALLVVFTVLRNLSGSWLAP